MVHRVREGNRAVVERLMKRVDYYEWCEKMGIPLTPHHIVPVSQGGPDTGENLIVLGLPCHDHAQQCRIEPKELSRKARSRESGWTVFGPVKGFRS